MKMTTEQQASYALEWDLDIATQPAAVQAEMRRLMHVGYGRVQAPPVPAATPAPVARRRRGPGVNNILRSVYFLILLPFGLVAFAVHAVMIGVLLTFGCVLGIAYHLLPWEVWVQTWADKNGRGEGQA
jgi:hypothetical protein